MPENLEQKQAGESREESAISSTDRASSAKEPHCSNCGSALVLNYCANCGQHVHHGARNLSLVLADAWHDVTHLDGRLWLTIRLLLVSPGALTLEYFQDRRARYLPPIRLYLVVSLIFFSIGLAGGSRPQTLVSGQRSEPASPDPLAEATRDTPELSHWNRNNRGRARCRGIHVSGMASLERLLRDSCERNLADHGGSFTKSLAHNIPKMMFVFLPLMAGAMALLYWMPTRYYVEHLIFLIHNHCAVFISFLLADLSDLLSSVAPAIANLDDLVELVIVVYVAWYPFAAMRRYYQQSRIVTAIKYVAVGVSYGACLLLTFIGTALWTAIVG